MDKTMWMVRADEGGRLFEDFRKGSFVAIGWGALGDMSRLDTREDFTRAVAKAWPEMKRMQIAVSAGQALRFVRELKVGDRVLTYDPSERTYLIGTLASEYIHDPERPEFSNVRKVEWAGTVSRDQLSVSTRNSLGAISTLFLVPHDAALEIEQLLKGSGSPAELAKPEEEQTLVEAIFKESQGKAFEFIKDKINRLDWDEMQELVAGLLRAMGYKTRVSPSGSDRGKDIVASPDGFGFENPRIVVEVKHRSAAMLSGSARIPWWAP